MIERLILVGASGDLTGRFLLLRSPSFSTRANFPTISESSAQRERIGTTRGFGSTQRSGSKNMLRLTFPPLRASGCSTGCVTEKLISASRKLLLAPSAPRGTNQARPTR